MNSLSDLHPRALFPSNSLAKRLAARFLMKCPCKIRRIPADEGTELMPTQASNIGAILASYTGNIRVPARRCLPLALRLEHAAPDDITADQRTKLGAVSARAHEVDAVLTMRERGSGAVLREPRNAVATSWNAMHVRLTAMASVPPDLGPEGPEASLLASSLFPEGVSFTQYDAIESWQHSRRLLQRIDDEGVKERLEALAGPIFLRHVERSVARLGEAIGVRGSPVNSPSPRALADAVARFSFAVGAYARALSVDVNEGDESTIERFLSALSGIDEMRTTRGAEEEEEEEKEPEKDGTPGIPDDLPSPFIKE